VNDPFEYCEEWFDNCGAKPFIREYKGVVGLHFHLFQVQSEMYRDAPDVLVLRYTQAMMDFRHFNPQPRHIGMIGLGGGSIQKHCFTSFPDATISVAEINEGVIALRDYFYIPSDDDRFHIYCEDGADFVVRNENQFDVLLVDGFDSKGQPPQLCSLRFYKDCFRALTPKGILVVNACDNRGLIVRIKRAFGNEVLVVDDDRSENVIVFAGRGDILCATEIPGQPLIERQHPY
jgi:spermidine synthase